MDFTDKYAKDADERLLLRRISDLVRRSSREYQVLYSSFLTPAEQSLIMKVGEFFGSVSFEGGYEDAERRVCRVCTDQYQPDSGAPIVLLNAEVTAPDADISHRDVLGSLMGLGIRRDMIGDIIASGGKASFFCCESVAAHILMSMTRLGRYSVKLQTGEAAALPEPEMKRSVVNVSSMRADSLCAEGFRMSRTKAQELIRRGLVCVNWQVCLSPSQELKPGDRLSARGFGKLRIGEITGKSKRDRLFVEIFRWA